MANFLEVTVRSWRDLQQLAEVLPSFVFRGQADARWGLSTSLERCFERFKSQPLRLYENSEHWILHELKRRYHLYATNAPVPDDHFEWLSILQHHGCPTRLLDFTQSIYVAAYFAIADTTDDAAIWAVNYWTLRDNTRQSFKLPYRPGQALKDEINTHHIALANSFIANRNPAGKRAFVLNLEPFASTQRLSAQQGLFLMPTDLKQPFMQNLFSSYGCADESSQLLKHSSIDKLTLDSPKRVVNSDIDLIKIVLPKALHERGLEDLTRMNITAETLFPGLDGLARSFVQTIIRW